MGTQTSLIVGCVVGAFVSSGGRWLFMATHIIL
jgi:hypothetical protein